MQIEQIVVATDLSKEAERTLGPATSLAKKTGAKINLVHAIHTMDHPKDGEPMGTLVGPPDYDAEIESAERELEKLAGSLETETSHCVVTGSGVARSIVRYANEIEADLLAISTHGRTGLGRLVMGSVAEEVLRRSDVPVLCFPQRDPHIRSVADVEHILLTTDLSTEALRPFEPVLELAKQLDCRVTVLHVVRVLAAIPYGAPLAPPVKPPDLGAAMDHARATAIEQCSSLGAANLDVVVVEHDKPAIAVAEFAAKNDVDLVAISTHGRTGWRRAAMGSVAEQILRRSPVPVLSFHSNKA